MFSSTLKKGEKECFLEVSEMQRSLPYSKLSADESPYKTFQILLSGFLISEEPPGPTLHSGGFVLR